MNLQIHNLTDNPVLRTTITPKQKPTVYPRFARGRRPRKKPPSRGGTGRPRHRKEIRRRARAGSPGQKAGRPRPAARFRRRPDFPRRAGAPGGSRPVAPRAEGMPPPSPPARRRRPASGGLQTVRWPRPRLCGIGCLRRDLAPLRWRWRRRCAGRRG